MRRIAGMDNISLDASSKSLRGYATRVHPLNMERILQHYALNEREKVIRGKTFTYNASYEGLSGSNYVNFALQSFYDQEAREGIESIIIYPRLSVKTLIGPRLSKDTMREDIEKWVDSHVSLTTRVASLRELATEELGKSVVDNLLNDYVNSSLSQGILVFLLNHQWTFPSHDYVVVRGRESPIPGLVMKQKYYANRDDNRAYCQDRNRLRLLCGAILHRLILPKSSRVRSNLHVSKVIRSDRKDQINLVVPRAREGQTTLLILGDVSNFTGSLGNSWLLLHAVAIDLSKHLRNKFSPISVGGRILYATWFEVIAFYLYLTVGCECYVEELDKYEQLPGGFLGVGANITTGLLFLSLFLIDLNRRLVPRVFCVQSQAGGDDFALLLVVKEEDKIRIGQFINREIKDHVGHLKEFQVYETDSLYNNSVIDGAYFCRKRVTLCRSNSHTAVGFEPSCPLHQSIFSDNNIRRFDLQCRAWRELDLGLKAYEEDCPGMSQYCDSLREVFLGKYPDVSPTRVRVMRSWPLYGLVGRIYDGFLVSERALSLIRNIESIQTGPLYVLAATDSKIRHLQVAEEIISIDLLYRGSQTTAYLCAEDESLLDSERFIDIVGVYPDWAIVDRISKIV
jgi:hypothetical protein